MPREVWRKAGGAGLLCPDVPEEFGGYGADGLYNVVIIEELAKAGMSGPGFRVLSEMVAPYIRTWGSDELQAQVAPPDGHGRGNRRGRDDRAGCGQRPQGTAHPRNSRRR